MTGEPDPIRTHLLRQLALPAAVGAQIGVRSDQVTRLRQGLPVVVHRDQLAMFGHPNMPDLAGSDWWQLTGPNTLEPTEAPT